MQLGKYFADNKSCLAVAALFAVAGIALHLHLRLYAEIRDCYAVHTVTDMMIEHLKAHNGAWPEGWDDLQDDYGTCSRRSPQLWNFDDLRNRIDVEWMAGSTAFTQSLSIQNGTRQFNVVLLHGGNARHWQLRKANQKLLDYLCSRMNEEPEPVDVNRSAPQSPSPASSSSPRHR